MRRFVIDGRYFNIEAERPGVTDPNRDETISAGTWHQRIEGPALEQAREHA